MSVVVGLSARGAPGGNNKHSDRHGHDPRFTALCSIAVHELIVRDRHVSTGSMALAVKVLVPARPSSPRSSVGMAQVRRSSITPESQSPVAPESEEIAEKLTGGWVQYRARLPRFSVSDASRAMAASSRVSAIDAARAASRAACWTLSRVTVTRPQNTTNNINAASNGTSATSSNVEVPCSAGRSSGLVVVMGAAKAVSPISETQPKHHSERNRTLRSRWLIKNSRELGSAPALRLHELLFQHTSSRNKGCRLMNHLGMRLRISLHNVQRAVRFARSALGFRAPD
jgi:hypothetical protein